MISHVKRILSSVICFVALASAQKPEYDFYSEYRGWSQQQRRASRSLKPDQIQERYAAKLRREEVAEADLILHVRDAAHPDTTSQRADVIGVLSEMERDGTLDENWRGRVIEVLNKADLMGGVAAVSTRGGSVAVSAITQEGLRALCEAIDRHIAAGMETADYAIVPSDGARLAWLYEHGEVMDRRDTDDTVHVTVRLLPADRARFESQP